MRCISLLHGRARDVRRQKNFSAGLRRAAVLGIIVPLVATAVMYSRNENAPTEVGRHSSKQAFQQPKDRPQAEGWFNPTQRAPEISDDKGQRLQTHPHCREHAPSHRGSITS
jgi:hypothetical protein